MEAWGRIAHMADPFGHGIRFIEFLGRALIMVCPASPHFPNEHRTHDGTKLAL
jgi:hypothetical protein